MLAGHVGRSNAKVVIIAKENKIQVLFNNPSIVIDDLNIQKQVKYKFSNVYISDAERASSNDVFVGIMSVYASN